MQLNKLKKLINQGENLHCEFKENFGRELIETLVAFANTRGGNILVGISDNGRVAGIKTKEESIQSWLNQIKLQTQPALFPDIEEVYIDDKKVVVFNMPEHPIKPVSFKGRYFKRVFNSNHRMSISEIADMHLKTFNSSWDYYPDTHHDLKQISLEKVNQFIEMANKQNQFIKDDPLTVLHKFELIKDSQITNGCFLLFTTQETLLTDIEIGRFSNGTVIKDSLTVRADLFSEVELVIGFIMKHINKGYIITGKPQREERWEYPPEALREIVINMIVHRDYMQSSGSIIKIFDDRIEFFNPGKLPGNLTIQKLLTGNYISNIRNKQIAAIFKEAGLIEKYGSGIQRVLTAFSEYQLPQPQFEEVQHGFMVTVFNTPHKTPQKTLQKTPQKTTQKKTLSDRILDMLREHPKITQKEIADSLGIGFFTVREYFQKLKRDKKIMRIGGRKGGYWQVNDKS